MVPPCRTGFCLEGVVQGTNQSLGRLSLVKLHHVVHQDSLRQCTTWEWEHRFYWVDKSNSALPKQTVRLKTRAKTENHNSVGMVILTALTFIHFLEE